MKRIVLLGLLALALPVTATAGGWATVQLSSTPKGLRAGVVWDVRITVLQHGRTPLDGLKPRVTIRKDTRTVALRKGSPRVRTFLARPTGEAGVYRARVVFPSAGTWRYSVWDGFSEYGGAREHTYAPVHIGPAV
jgi:hypothetical protein